MITEIDDYIRSVVKVIDAVDKTRRDRTGKHRTEIAGISLYTQAIEQKDRTTRLSLGGDGWLLILSIRKRLPKNPTENRVQLKHSFLYSGEMWITNYTILSPEKFEDDLTILKLLT